MQLNALFCCLWRNVEASCHKHFVVFSRNQHRRLLPAMCHTQLAGRWPWSTGDSVDNTWHVAALTASIKARYRPRIAISAYPTCIGRPVRVVLVVWHGKTTMAWLPDGEKILMICLFVLTQLTNVTHTHTDRQTPHDGIGRAYA